MGGGEGVRRVGEGGREGERVASVRGACEDMFETKPPPIPACDVWHDVWCVVWNDDTVGE